MIKIAYYAKLRKTNKTDWTLEMIKIAKLNKHIKI